MNSMNLFKLTDYVEFYQDMYMSKVALSLNGVLLLEKLSAYHTWAFNILYQIIGFIYILEYI